MLLLYQVAVTIIKQLLLYQRIEQEVEPVA